MQALPFSREHLFAGDDYDSRKKSSEIFDRELGFEIDAVEVKLRARPPHFSDQENWSRLSPQVFQTPYGELAEIVERVDPQGTLDIWVDLGAAYGRLAFVLNVLRPRARFLGVELESERVAEANRVFAKYELPNSTMVAADLTHFEIPPADVYFLYDFGSEKNIEVVLEKLRLVARERPILLIGRGRRIRDLLERRHPWLASVQNPEHHAHYSIYRS